MRGVTRINQSSVHRIVISTHTPRERRDNIEKSGVETYTDISTHTPRERRDKLPTDRSKAYADISTHTPRERRDNGSFLCVFAHIHFNSHAS